MWFVATPNEEFWRRRGRHHRIRRGVEAALHASGPAGGEPLAFEPSRPEVVGCSRMWRLVLLQLLLPAPAAAAAARAADVATTAERPRALLTFELFDNYSAVCGPCGCGGPYEPSIRAAKQTDTPDSKYLGQHNSSAGCAAACGALPACAAFTWYTPTGNGWKGGCTGIVNTSYNGWWSPYSLGGGCLGAVSGIRHSRCDSDESCSLNGQCDTAGRCACDAGWLGYDCGRLDLRPTPRTAGYNAPSAEQAAEQSANSSWGGSVVASTSSGGFIMFAAQLAQHCGIAAWEPTSLVVRARSETGVLGPCAPLHPPALFPHPHTHTYLHTHARTRPPARPGHPLPHMHAAPHVTDSRPAARR